MVSAREIPDATVSRLPVYRRSLVELAASGETTVSSARLAELSGVNAAKVRKDLSYLGTYGIRGVGYDVENLLIQIGESLGLDVEAPVVIVGMGNLGQALARYGGFESRGFPIVALVDAAATTVGQTVQGIEIRHVDDLPALVAELGLAVGIIATPAEAAQTVADSLVGAGVKAILTFAPTIIDVPVDVPLRKVDLATELQILSYYQQRGTAESDRTA
ncbi:MAG: redox-sensing transcriptional repressor Rex [Acidimicrobiales bacterium]